MHMTPSQPDCIHEAVFPKGPCSQVQGWGLSRDLWGDIQPRTGANPGSGSLEVSAGTKARAQSWLRAGDRPWT